MPDSVLEQLDVVVGAVNLSRTKKTERILRAMQHLHFTLLEHPTGRS